jgi:phosphohistidine phosphatase
MRHYLVQHGQAKSEEEDPSRPLTGKGAEDVARVAAYAGAHFGVQPTLVIHSGKTRAQQTAEIWGRQLGVEVEEADGLAPNDEPSIWAGRLAEATDDVMLVGHLPHLPRLTSLLLTGSADRVLVAFTNGGLVALDGTNKSWSVAIALPPP